MCESCDSERFSEDEIAEQMPKARQAVQKGVALLDRFGPSDWRQQIDINELSMGSPYTCVLAQSFKQEIGSADYWEAKKLLMRLSETDFNAGDYGFNDQTDVYNPVTDRYEFHFGYAALRAAWLEELSKEIVPA